MAVCGQVPRDHRRWRRVLMLRLCAATWPSPSYPYPGDTTRRALAAHPLGSYHRLPSPRNAAQRPPGYQTPSDPAPALSRGPNVSNRHHPANGGLRSPVSAMSLGAETETTTETLLTTPLDPHPLTAPETGSGAGEVVSARNVFGGGGGGARLFCLSGRWVARCFAPGITTSWRACAGFCGAAI